MINSNSLFRLNYGAQKRAHYAILTNKQARNNETGVKTYLNRVEVKTGLLLELFLQICYLRAGLDELLADAEHVSGLLGAVSATSVS